jgi:hypothetical protein
MILRVNKTCSLKQTKKITKKEKNTLTPIKILETNIKKQWDLLKDMCKADLKTTKFILEF